MLAFGGDAPNYAADQLHLHTDHSVRGIPVKHHQPRVEHTQLSRIQGFPQFIQLGHFLQRFKHCYIKTGKAVTNSDKK